MNVPNGMKISNSHCKRASLISDLGLFSRAYSFPAPIYGSSLIGAGLTLRSGQAVNRISAQLESGPH